MFHFPNTSLLTRKLLRRRGLRVFYCHIYTSFSLNSKTQNHYETLKLPTNCSSKEIREAFISLSKQYHPDKNKGNPKAQEQFVKVNEAYSVLIKAESRRNYDSNLQNFSGPSQAYTSNTSQRASEYYKVRRQDQDQHYYYKDPWKDPSFARNRNFSKEDEDSYYRKKGYKKISNENVARWILMFAGVSLFIQFFFVKFSLLVGRDSLNKRSEENIRYLQAVRERAESYGTKEQQIEALRQRVSEDEEK